MIRPSAHYGSKAWLLYGGVLVRRRSAGALTPGTLYPGKLTELQPTGSSSSHVSRLTSPAPLLY